MVHDHDSDSLPTCSQVRMSQYDIHSLKSVTTAQKSCTGEVGKESEPWYVTQRYKYFSRNAQH